PTNQNAAGVIENMSWLEQPDGTRMELFGSGGGQRVADTLTEELGREVPLLGQVPLEMALREGSDAGAPLVSSDSTSEAAQVLRSVAGPLGHRSRGWAGKQSAISPVG